jgi:hypothetical protein
MLTLDGFKLTDKDVILVIGYLGRIEHMIAIIMIIDLPSQLFSAFFKRFLIANIYRPQKNHGLINGCGFQANAPRHATQDSIRINQLMDFA